MSSLHRSRLKANIQMKSNAIWTRLNDILWSFICIGYIKIISKSAVSLSLSECITFKIVEIIFKQNFNKLLWKLIRIFPQYLLSPISLALPPFRKSSSIDVDMIFQLCKSQQTTVMEIFNLCYGFAQIVHLFLSIYVRNHSHTHTNAFLVPNFICFKAKEESFFAR